MDAPRSLASILVLCALPACFGGSKNHHGGEADAGTVALPGDGGAFATPADAATVRFDAQPPPPQERCGDQRCDLDETCSSCPDDCGACDPYCGDGTCGTLEYCFTCPEDCGECPTFCGDGTCDPDEGC